MMHLVKRQDGLLEPADDDTLRQLQNMPVGIPFTLEAPNTDKTRTDTQRKALEVFCRLMAHDLNECGMYQNILLDHSVDLPWTQATVKENLFKPLMSAMLQKESTTEANTTDYNKVYQVLCHHLSTKHGFTCPNWPSRHG